ncbi:leucine-rich repeat receptor-like protein kinase [Musa troglodytarum]|uniref:Leucine-rich repeat receptor-like protein kinase n=1 Tax=Musa troglodytarum TaxID=320322 RepID=A0A9E7IG01_9LILI|nr:leucine-rich repeat receptor-like protein kinase [Musa troglodytarum]
MKLKPSISFRCYQNHRVREASWRSATFTLQLSSAPTTETQGQCIRRHPRHGQQHQSSIGDGGFPKQCFYLGHAFFQLQQLHNVSGSRAQTPSSSPREPVYLMDLRLVGNPVCSNAQLHETEYCHEPQDSGSGSSITDCLHPYEGPIVCRAPSFSDVSRNLAPMANRLASMVNGTPVSFSLQNYFFDGDAYLQVQLTICPSSAKHFTRREILQWFDLSSQSLALSEIYGPCYFDPWQYSFRRSGIEFLLSTLFDFVSRTHRSVRLSVNRGLIAGIVVGCVAAVLAIAGLGSYALWQKKRAKKAIILQNPFGKQRKNTVTVPWFSCVPASVSDDCRSTYLSVVGIDRRRCRRCTTTEASEAFLSG